MATIISVTEPEKPIPPTLKTSQAKVVCLLLVTSGSIEVDT